MRQLGVWIAVVVSLPAFAVDAAEPARVQGACALRMDPALAEGPVALGFGEVDVATGRRVCPRTELSFGGRAGAVVDTADFYGFIGAGALVSGSWALGDGREVFATVALVDYQWNQNAVIVASRLGLGQTTAGMTWIVAQGESWATATTVRLMLPTSTLMNVRVLGGEVGQGLTLRFGPRLEVHGFAGIDASAAVFAPAAQPRLGGLLNVGVQYAPASWFGVVADVNGRIGGWTQYLAPTLGFRFRVYGGLGAELAGTIPLAGTDRHDGMVGLRLGYRLSP